ncbi:MAG: Gfo/Idh/MocA family oxidoreductase [Leptolyngbyaceae cyanobacterium RM1_1_2]|nr:Gfo/Idh/MocA family oxidoreductase [Leptolyngbyaceae cyanobacterium RM1_1_2]
MDLNPIKIGIIGCGYWGTKLIKKCSELKTVQIIALCDRDRNRLADFGKHYSSVVLTDNPQEFLAAPTEAVIIATPASTHYALAKAALRAGKHALVEKPLTCCLHEAKDLISLAQKNCLALKASHIFHHNPAIALIRELVGAEKIGKVQYVDLVRSNLGKFRSDVSALWDLAYHDISILNYLLPKKPLAISAHGQSYVQKNLTSRILSTLLFTFLKTFFQQLELAG